MTTGHEQPLAQRDDELFDVVDERDNVIRQETRRDVHANDWLHRAVHIWVFNSSGKLLLQMRSPEKDQYPSTWTSSASGHVDAGESYETAAVRELHEELGLDASIEFATKLPASRETAFEFTSLWTTTTDAIPQPNPVEVTAVQWWDVCKAIQAMTVSPSQFSPPLRELLAWWSRHRA